MGRVIVPLTLLILLFAAFVIWRVQVGRERKREEMRERNEWADRLLDDN